MRATDEEIILCTVQTAISSSTTSWSPFPAGEGLWTPRFARINKLGKAKASPNHQHCWWFSRYKKRPKASSRCSRPYDRPPSVDKSSFANAIPLILLYHSFHNLSTVKFKIPKPPAAFFFAPLDKSCRVCYTVHGRKTQRDTGARSRRAARTLFVQVHF